MADSNPTAITSDDERLSNSVRAKLRDTGTDQLWFIGDIAILNRRLLAFFCSRECPGDVILKTYDAIRQIRDADIAVIGGFHSPMEKECLELLLAGSATVVVCPARGLGKMRIPATWREPIETGRLLVVSPFDPNVNAVRAVLAVRRNDFAASLASKLLVPHAAPTSTTEDLCRDWLKAGKWVYTIQADSNTGLADDGALPLPSGDEIARDLA